LGRALWRTLPEDRFDLSPQRSRGGRYALVADVRIDNRDELISDCGLRAEDSAGLCDAALLLCAIEKWGLSALDRIIGPYAFALWDGIERCLSLARDPFGLRPLCYHSVPGFFAFATMAKGLHAVGRIPRAPDFEELASLHALWPPTGARTFFEGIERVRAGHIVKVTATGGRRRDANRCACLARAPMPKVCGLT